MTDNVVQAATDSLSIIEGDRLTLMNVSVRSYLVKLTVLCHGYASIAFWKILSRAFTNCIDSSGASYTVASLKPANV